MAAVINATPGDASANSYLTLLEAGDIAMTRVDTKAWDAATEDARTRALISATAAIDTLSFIGSRSSSTQALSWPRSNVSTTEHSYLPTEIPSPIRQATYELAAALLVNPNLVSAPSTSTSLIPNIPNSDLKRVKLDVMEVEWRDGRSTSGAGVNVATLIPFLHQLLLPLLSFTSGSNSTVYVVRS